MSPQLVVDEHLDYWKVTQAIARWMSAAQIGFEIGRKSLPDDNIRAILRTIKRRTFITIDKGFYRCEFCDKRYCIVFFNMSLVREDEIPHLLRKLLRFSEFQTSKKRMGKVIRVSRGGGIHFFDSRTGSEKYLPWTP